MSDTINRDVTNLDNTDWHELLQTVKLASRGEHGITSLNLMLTEELAPSKFFVMLERWMTVADWVSLAFAPVYEVEHAVDI